MLLPCCFMNVVAGACWYSACSVLCCLGSVNPITLLFRWVVVQRRKINIWYLLPSGIASRDICNSPTISLRRSLCWYSLSYPWDASQRSVLQKIHCHCPWDTCKSWSINFWAQSQVENIDGEHTSAYPWRVKWMLQIFLPWKIAMGWDLAELQPSSFLPKDVECQWVFESLSFECIMESSMQSQGEHSYYTFTCSGLMSYLHRAWSCLQVDIDLDALHLLCIHSLDISRCPMSLNVQP